MQVYDKKTTGMHWHIHKDGAHFFHEFKKQGKVMECAVAIGADPTVCYSASAPLPYGIDEFLFAGFIRKSPVPLVKCKTIDLEIPASAEIVLEGFIDPSEMRLEGPFGDHTGYYSQMEIIRYSISLQLRIGKIRLSYNHRWKTPTRRFLLGQSD